MIGSHSLFINLECIFSKQDQVADSSQEGTFYRNMYSIRDGLIATLPDSFKAPAESISWSDATFAAWESITALWDHDMGDIRYIGAADVHDKLTSFIIDRIIPPRSRNGMQVWKHGTEPYLALLGTESGEMAVRFLMEHKKILLRKTVARILVFQEGLTARGEGKKHLVYEVWNMPAPWNQGVEGVDGGRSSALLPLPSSDWRDVCHMYNISATGGITNA